ncbi:protein-disulfide reductase DsbD family protein [Cellvibrio polysaccharolyticus]|uniref:Cytochrome C biogenesis protein n=1 Tax=Cellvibrio polysaccharolyticus TaxID=2082724 RepID=A0A928V5Y2_9GAMM|nr:protein-disulfide reductase DsbD [Cellvibrio polysaccharolyticus]MBE8716704.1 cytochrome C biogenesis protein [Cellvibrio polysaccharolyticus]
MTTFLHTLSTLFKLTRPQPRLLLALLLTLPLLQPALADDFLGQPKASGNLGFLPVNDEFLPVTEAFRLQPELNGQQLTLHWTIAPHYYLYEERFRLRNDQQLTLTPQYQQGITKYDEFFEKEMTVFYQSATVVIDLPEHRSPLNLQVESQGCADAGLCYPPHTDYLQIDLSAGTVTVTDIAPANAPAETAPTTTTAAPLWLPHALLLALLGGIVLNLMPCVFPVLSIKVMSLTQADPQRLASHGWSYTAGVLLSFLALAGILLAARAGGEAIGWGFQLQSPLLVTALIYLFVVMALALAGNIQIGQRWMGAGESLTSKHGLQGSFFTGVLAAVVASPCTAPFMGAALGFALTQPTVIGLAVFAALGFGMALPLLLLCYAPGLARYLPKPGGWMETFKEVLAFPLYLTAIWLLWVLGRQAGMNAVAAACVGALLITFGFWLLGKKKAGHKSILLTLVVLLCWAGSALLPWKTLQSSTSSSLWQPWSEQKLQSLRAEGKPVFVNMTADWCLTCLANERLVLSTSEIEEAFTTLGIVGLKGDWTNTDPAITAFLQTYGRSGVPLYVWFPAGHQGAGIVLPQLLTRGQTLSTLQQNGTKPTN